MKNSKGVTIVFITIIILVIILIAFLVYEIVFVDIFDIMNKNEVAKNNKPILNISTNVNEINEDEINITQNVQQNEEYTNLENIFVGSFSYFAIGLFTSISDSVYDFLLGASNVIISPLCGNVFVVLPQRFNHNL